MPEEVVKAVKKVLPAVVSIVAADTFNPQKAIVLPEKRKRLRLRGGSGFIVGKGGVILTNRHVVESKKADYVVILQSGEKLTPTISAVDPINDIAILKIKKDNLPVIKFADSSKLELGQDVVAIGNALGLFKNTVSTGVISGLSREIKAQNGLNQEQTSLRGLIQTDAAINPGNSGGPLIDLKGRAVGINAAMVFGAENIGFALPINNAKRDLKELKEHGRIRQPFLGIRYMCITEDLKKEFDLPVGQGALVMAEPDFLSKKIEQAVVPNSPAHKAGIKEADIILEVENEKVTPEKTISDILQNEEIGRKLNLKILRKGKEKTLKIVLGER